MTGSTRRRRATVQAAGWRVLARGGLVWLTAGDDRDPGMRPAEAKALAAALQAAALQAQRDRRAER